MRELDFMAGVVLGFVIGAPLGAIVTDSGWSSAAIKGGQAHFSPDTGKWTWDGWHNELIKKTPVGSPSGSQKE